MSWWRFAAAESDGPAISIAPEKLFDVGGVAITNSMFYGWVSALLIISLLVYYRKQITLQGSRGIARIFDAGTEFIVNILATALGSRDKALRYAPLFAATFFFIILNNWLGLIPGAGHTLEYNGAPVLRPFTADLNATLAMSSVMIVIVLTLAIRQNGALGQLKHYFPGTLKNPMNVAIGIMEMFSELTRVISLGLRLFLNVAIGEILIAVFSYLGGTYGAPLAALPFTLLELFVGLLQAYIFVVLAISYLAVATVHHDDHAKEHA